MPTPRVRRAEGRTMSKVETTVIARRTVRLKVTMEWEVDAEVEDHQSPGVISRGWISDYSAIAAQCDPKTARRVSYEAMDREEVT